MDKEEILSVPVVQISILPLKTFPFFWFLCREFGASPWMKLTALVALPLTWTAPSSFCWMYCHSSRIMAPCWKSHLCSRGPPTRESERLGFLFVCFHLICKDFFFNFDVLNPFLYRCCSFEIVDNLSMDDIKKYFCLKGLLSKMDGVLPVSWPSENFIDKLPSSCSSYKNC